MSGSRPAGIKKLVVGGLLVVWTVLAGMPVEAAAPALKAKPGSKAEEHVNQGLVDYNRSAWEPAKQHFLKAVVADPQSAEAHYNLALTLDQLGDHKQATEHFIKAYTLGKGNPEIQNSGILRAHIR